MNLFRKTPQENTAYYELLDEIERVKTQMDNAYYNFQNAMDPDLIDCYIFESNAAWKRYRFLLRQAKGVSSTFGHETENFPSNIHLPEKTF